MTSDWGTQRIGEIAQVVGGGTPRTSEPENFGGDFPWLTPNDLKDHLGIYVQRGERSLTQAGIDSSSARLHPTGTVLVSSRAPIGYVAIAANPIATNQGFRSLILGEGYLPEFYYYVMLTKREEMEAVAGGSTFKEISGKTLKTIEVPVPPLQEQAAIAEVLTAFDARLVWSSRCERGLLDAIQTLHLLELSKSSEEWGIYEVADVEYGAPYSSSEFNEDQVGLPVIRIRDIDEDDASVYTEERHSRDVLIDSGDIVVGMDGEFRAEPWRGPRALLNQRVCVFRPKQGVSQASLLEALRYPLTYYERAITGTTVKHLGKKHIDQFQLDMPAGPDTGRVGESLLDEIVRLARERRTVRQLRDELIPRLVSGELAPDTALARDWAIAS